MNFWPYFWSIFFVVGLSLFAILSLVVTIGGFADIKSLLKSLENQHHQKKQSDN